MIIFCKIYFVFCCLHKLLASVLLYYYKVVTLLSCMFRTKTQPRIRDWLQCSLNFNNCKWVWLVDSLHHESKTNWLYIVTYSCHNSSNTCTGFNFIWLQAEMDTRSAKFKQQLRERDTQINRLQRELRVRVYTILLEFFKYCIFMHTGSKYFWRWGGSYNPVSLQEAKGELFPFIWFLLRGVCKASQGTIVTFLTCFEWCTWWHLVVLSAQRYKQTVYSGSAKSESQTCKAQTLQLLFTIVSWSSSNPQACINLRILLGICFKSF